MAKILEMNSKDMHKAAANVTLEVQFVNTKEWTVRKFLAGQLIKLSCKIMGCGIEFTDKDEDNA